MNGREKLCTSGTFSVDFERNKVFCLSLIRDIVREWTAWLDFDIVNTASKGGRRQVHFRDRSERPRKDIFEG
jgi:hypothetical protein